MQRGETPSSFPTESKSPRSSLESESHFRLARFEKGEEKTEQKTTGIFCELASSAQLLQFLSFHPRAFTQVLFPVMTSGGGFGGSAKALSTSKNNININSAAETAAAVKKFTALGVCEQLAEAAAALGWTAPTEIQAAAVPHLLAGAWREGRRQEEEHWALERQGDGLIFLFFFLFLSFSPPSFAHPFPFITVPNFA